MPAGPSPRSPGVVLSNQATINTILKEEMDQDTETGTPPWPLATAAGESNDPLQVNLQSTAFRSNTPTDVIGSGHLVERAPVFHEPEDERAVQQSPSRRVPKDLSRERRRDECGRQ